VQRQLYKDVENGVLFIVEQLWLSQWLLDRNSERRMLNFVNRELRDDFCGFRGFLRMSFSEFLSLLLIIAPDIQKSDAVMRDFISPK